MAGNLLNLKLNAQVGEGRELSDHFKVNGVPQMIFVTNGGVEIDRIVGYLPPDQYLARVNDVLAGKNTLADLESKYQAGDDDLDLLVSLGEKYENKGDFDAATELYRTMLTFHSDNSSEEVNRARYFLAMEDFFDGDRTAIDQFLFKYSFSIYVKDAYQQMGRYYASEKDTANEVAVLQAMVKLFPDDTAALNAYAWRMTELEMHLEDALVKATHAVALETDDAMSRAQILDTQAEILWKLDRNEEAITIMEEALKIDPGSQYFKDQKAKFSGN